jgi:hypothetical protein
MTTNYKFIIRFRNNCKNFNLIKKNQKIRILKYCDVFETTLPFNKYEDYIKKQNISNKNDIQTVAKKK